MPDGALLHDVPALIPGAVTRDPFGIGVDRGYRIRSPVVPVPAVVFIPPVSPRVRFQGHGPKGSGEGIPLCRYRHERYLPVRLPAPLHDAAFPVCQVSLLVAYGSLVFCFSKAASTHRLVSYCTAKHNLLRYCTASPIPLV